MQGCAGDDEDMPEHILELQLLPEVEDDASRIGDAACDDQPERRGGERGGQRWKTKMPLQPMAR